MKQQGRSQTPRAGTNGLRRHLQSLHSVCQRRNRSISSTVRRQRKHGTSSPSCMKDKGGTGSLLQELFHFSMEKATNMDGYLRAIREKMSELSAAGTKLDKDIKLAIILNGLSEEYRYLVVNVEQQETVDFDELSARLIEEEHLIKSNGSIDG